MICLRLLGLSDYQKTLELQEKLVALVHDSKVDEVLIFCEHNPVVTQGRGKQGVQDAVQKKSPFPILPPGIDFVEISRGGDLTYHGPGQLVLYPIMNLQKHKLSLHEYIRKLEKSLIQTLSHYSVSASTKDGAAGVWVEQKKIASVGIAVRHWVSFHGIAVNLVNDLKEFHYFQPCGFSPEIMTRLQDQIGLATHSWRKDFEDLWKLEFESIFDLNECLKDRQFHLQEENQENILDYLTQE